MAIGHSLIVVEHNLHLMKTADYLIDLGKRPLKRPQPGQRMVLTLKALRSALRRTNDPDEIGSLAAFLCSNHARGV